MLLSDHNLRDEMAHRGLGIDGLSADAIGPASVDLMLSPHFVVFYGGQAAGVIDPRLDNSTDGTPVEVDEGGSFLLHPHQFALASTVERWAFPKHLAGRLEGKSSLGRLGLMVHTTAGFFDPGFEGYPTLELFNVRDRPIALHPGMPVAQMSVFSMVTASDVPYAARGGKYADQGPLPGQSLYHRNFEPVVAGG